ncbi:ABC transporter permease [Actinomyces radicidentis]|uniref:ABC transporter permease n=1 Tax=Actinomyces radicidentis TaxID=111015 RepID=UPI0028F02A5E|nr:ABC transporter permease [Actinomyces radicidentis]
MSTMSRSAEIRLVAGRELRTQLLKKSSIISTIIMTVLVVGGIVLASVLGGGTSEPYRLGVTGADPATVRALTPALEQVRDSDGARVSVVDLSGRSTADVDADLTADDDSDSAVDMALVLGEEPTLRVQKASDDAVVSGVTAALQQAALAQQITALGGDPAEVSATVAGAAPQVVTLEKDSGSGASGPQYLILMVIDVLLFIVIMGGGQMIAMGVVEEKASRIVEILLACVRPTSLLAGKVLGTGTAVIASYALMGVVSVVAARATGVMPSLGVDLNGVVVAMVVWMVIGFATVAVLYGAAGSLVSRQEDVSSVTMPLMMLCMVPYMLSIFMAQGDPTALVWRVLAYVPVFSAFLMPARLVLGASSWAEQGVALAIAIVALPLLVRLAATVYTRAVTRTGGRVPLKEVLGRRAA